MSIRIIIDIPGASILKIDGSGKSSPDYGRRAGIDLESGRAIVFFRTWNTGTKVVYTGCRRGKQGAERP
jgi:hypothetical protein